MKCKHGFDHCGLCHDKAGNLWPHLGESSASPACSIARDIAIDEALEAVDSALDSMGAGDLSGWELSLIRRRIEAIRDAQ